MTNGTTLCLVLVTDKQVFCANVGDSRAIARVNGEVFELSHDHKPNNEKETARIEATGKHKVKRKAVDGEI